MTTDKQTKLIIALLCSALLMTMALLVLDRGMLTSEALAGSMQDRGGDYAITMARQTDSQEAVWVMDARSRTIGVYMYDVTSKRLELLKTLVLAESQ
ncbi:MAG: hypothetical protein GXY33_06000 [Phycisphaerae bacterium]|nr:hypothetical protein [Phycisphaerae bacterium]